MWMGLLNPLGVPDAARALAGRGVTSFALELLPRISRAQSMDALTSMATVAGYKAVLLAAGALQKMCPVVMTTSLSATTFPIISLWLLKEAGRPRSSRTWEWTTCP